MVKNTLIHIAFSVIFPIGKSSLIKSTLTNKFYLYWRLIKEETFYIFIEKLISALGGNFDLGLLRDPDEVTLHRMVLLH